MTEDTGGSEEFRLPIGLQRPWWASGDDASAPPPAAAKPKPKPKSTPEPEAEVEAKPEAEAKPEPESAPVPEPKPGPEVKAKPEPKSAPVPEAESEPAPEPEAEKKAPKPSVPPLPGTLVAGRGVPNVDTRGAVPAEPIVQRPGPSYPDTDPDGIPVMRPDEAAAGAPKPPAEPGNEPADEAKPEVREAAPEPALTPDAVLPRESGPADDATDTPTAPLVIAPVYHAEGGMPIDGGPRTFSAGPLSSGPSGAPAGKKGGGRKPLLIGGGVVAAAIIAIAAFAIVGGDSDSKSRTAKAAESSGTKTEPQPSQPQAPAPTGTSAPDDGAPPSTIDSARTDGKALALTEAFPSNQVTLGGRTYVRDRASVNHQCALTARGAMAKALTDGRCSSVVRVTFLDKERALAVTSGIAVLPTKAGALKASRAGDPSKYEWFRGMGGGRTKNIDRAGGYAAGTVRGRYIAYAYATYANGDQPKPDDPMLKSVAEQFVGYALRPIDARARS
ncbi:hypothetical protein [Actinomadura sp. 9N407]|uniref:hypothetical protein n=1 Tax=Actinomadura sp. 9N407 TaxID=3375154 RepID=UPI0037ABB9F3